MPRRLESLLFDVEQEAVEAKALLDNAGIPAKIDGPFARAEVAVRVNNLRSRVKRLDGKTVWLVQIVADIP